VTLLIILALLVYCLKQWRQALPHRRKTKGLFVLLATFWLLLQISMALLPLLAVYSGLTP
jgi:hypothetical protein